MTASSTSGRPEDIINSTVRDEARLAALRRYQILDTEPEPAFDRAAKLAAHLFGASTALVNVLAEQREWYKSALNVEQDEGALETSICIYALDNDDVFVVEDLSADERFADNPLVTDRGLHFYAGAPLITPGSHRLGTLCVLDSEPRSPDEDTLDRLTDLADMVVDELELRRERAEHEQTRVQLEERQQVLRKSQQLADVGGSAYDPQADAVTWTDQTYRIFGLSPEAEVDLETAVDFYTPDSRSVLESEVERLLDEGGTYDLELDVVSDDGDRRRVRTIAEAQRDDGTTTQIVGAIQDVTERRRRKKTLERQNDLFTKAQDIASVGAWEYDVRSDEMRITDEAYRIGELSPAADVTRDRGVSFYHPDDQPIIRDAIAKAIEEGTPYDLELRLTTPEGERKWVRTRGEPQIEDGEVVRLRGTIQDITDRKEREETLRRQKTLLEQTQKLAGGWEVDLRAREMSWSEEVYRIHEVEPGTEVSIEEGIQFYAPEARPRMRESFEACIDEGKPYDLELPITTAAGNRRWVRTVGAPADTEDGEVVKVAGAFQDITDQKEAEQDLRRSREQLSMAVEGGNIGTWNWDLTTDEVLFNERWAGMLGYTREELDFHFRTWEDLVHPEDLPRALDELEAYIEGDADIYNPEIRMRTKAGEWKWIQTIGKVIERDEDGAVARAAGIHVDINDRKRAELALREAKSRYQTLVEHFPNGAVVLFDDDLRYTIARGQELNEIGLSPADFEGSTPRDLFSTEFAETTITYYRRALAGEKNVFEQTLDGQHYRVQTLPLRDEEGDVVAGMAVSQDITERKETRRQLEEYHDYTDRLLDAIDDVFFALGDNAQLERWNGRIPEVTGYTDEELDGMKAFALVPEHEHERLASKISDALTAGSAQMEIPLVRKDGTTIPYEFSGSLVQHPDGDFQIVGIGRNIADRKQREQLLEQAETFFQHAQDGLFLIDVDNDTDEPAFAVERINPAFEQATGLQEADIGGSSPHDILSEEEAEHAEAMYRRCVAERTSLEYEETVALDEAAAHFQTRIAPVVVDGTVEKIVGSTRDVTERVHRRQELEEAREAAEEANRMKTNLLANMNHEFRTPLTSVITFSKLIRDDPDVAGQFAERILSGGRRLLYTFDTFMELAQLKGEGISMSPVPLRLGDVLQPVVGDFTERGAGEDVGLVVDLSDEDRSVPVDKHLTERILIHLLHNAVKFTEAGTVTVAARTEPDHAELKVRDTGIGIDPDFLPRAFEAFTQASSGYARAYEGNGIGLTVVRHMVQQMNGTIDIESTPGKGTTVTVRLPVD